ncbi:PREDICTED: tyrosyl-DNA phosphodiesterase 2-like [Camelina sativa]|uniref:Tyrosyl-DNA phosphodiesterase 2-like n=1 Tax=Camelina sativa TaxID=90675 RepID=A0ABM0VMV8_CAMSA|nr:PREDICTED: tyrosyl-DNA phosphodiesterase 2-like [Camelina sativa]
MSKTRFFRILTTLPMSSSSSSTSWSCNKCTFLNSPSQKLNCMICLTPVSLPSSSSPSLAISTNDEAKWACKACTFLNTYKNSICDVCGTRSSASSLLGFDELTDSGLDSSNPDSSVGSVFFPLRRCSNKRKAMDDDVVEVDGGSVVRSESQGVVKKKNKEIETKGEASESGTPLSSLKILSYNVWFREDLELNLRMRAIGQIIQLHSPHLICFQEVTPAIYNIFRKSNWWKGYSCSVSVDVADSGAYYCMLLSKLGVKSFSSKSFRNSIMGRELSIAEVEVPGRKPLVFATSHLESPSPGPPKWDQMFSRERVEQAKEAIEILGAHTNVIFGGDMNWDDKLDGKFPLLDKWVDAWEVLKPGDIGFTYDTKANPMLSGNRALQKRLDRILCRLDDYKLGGIEMVGKEAIPEISHVKEKKVRGDIKKLELPVLPSDHFGLLLTLSPK